MVPRKVYGCDVGAVCSWRGTRGSVSRLDVDLFIMPDSWVLLNFEHKLRETFKTEFCQY